MLEMYRMLEVYRMLNVAVGLVSIKVLYLVANSGWGCGSVGRASDRHVADEASIPRFGKGFFFFFLPPRVSFQRRLSYGSPYTPVCSHMH